MKLLNAEPSLRVLRAPYLQIKINTNFHPSMQVTKVDLFLIPHLKNFFLISVAKFSSFFFFLKSLWANFGFHQGTRWHEECCEIIVLRRSRNLLYPTLSCLSIASTKLQRDSTTRYEMYGKKDIYEYYIYNEATDICKYFTTFTTWRWTVHISQSHGIWEHN